MVTDDHVLTVVTQHTVVVTAGLLTVFTGEGMFLTHHRFTEVAGMYALVGAVLAFAGTSDGRHDFKLVLGGVCKAEKVLLKSLDKAAGSESL